MYRYLAWDFSDNRERLLEVVKPLSELVSIDDNYVFYMNIRKAHEKKSLARHRMKLLETLTKDDYTVFTVQKVQEGLHHCMTHNCEGCPFQPFSISCTETLTMNAYYALDRLKGIVSYD